MMAIWVGFREVDDGKTVRRSYLRGMTSFGSVSSTVRTDDATTYGTKNAALEAVRSAYAGYPRAKGVRTGAVRVDGGDAKQQITKDGDQ